MKEKIQVKITFRDTFTLPQLETSVNSIDNQTAKEIAGNLSFEYIKILIKQGILVKNEAESSNITEVYDLVY
jgi:hypothetical protein